MSRFNQWLTYKAVLACQYNLIADKLYQSAVYSEVIQGVGTTQVWNANSYDYTNNDQVVTTMEYSVGQKKTCNFYLPL